MMFDVIPAAMPNVREGKFRPLAVGSAERITYVPELRDVPGMRELLPDLAIDMQSWYAINAPAGTPESRIVLLHRTITQIVRSDEFRKRMEPIGFTPIADEFTRSIRRVYARTGEGLAETRGDLGSDTRLILVSPSWRRCPVHIVLVHRPLSAGSPWSKCPASWPVGGIVEHPRSREAAIHVQHMARDEAGFLLEHRKATAGAISRGRVALQGHMVEERRTLPRAMRGAGDLGRAGATQFTRMPCGASSIASTWVRLMMPALLAP